MPDPDAISAPVVIEGGESFNVSLPARVTHETTLEKLKEIETDAATNLIEILYFGLTQAKSVVGICKGVDQIFKAMEYRRHLMMKPYGHKDKSSKGHNPIDLID